MFVQLRVLKKHRTRSSQMANLNYTVHCFCCLFACGLLVLFYSLIVALGRVAAPRMDPLKFLLFKTVL